MTISLRIASAFFSVLLTVSVYAAGEVNRYEIYENPTNKKLGIKKNGAILINPQFDMVLDISNAKSGLELEANQSPLFTVMSRGQWVRINDKNEVVFHPLFFDNGPDYYAQGFSRFVSKDNKCGFHDRFGKIMIPAKYHWAAPFSKEDFSREPLGTQYAVVCNDCFILPGEHEKWYPASTNEHRVSASTECCNHHSPEGGKWGIIDQQGNEIIPLAHNSYKEVIQELKEYKKRNR